ncbi:MAG: hypothetical protein GSR72_00130 [Desulfurococcales archaeon]|nr:hypothetical protein [Desulfurococcales archaeon]
MLARKCLPIVLTFVVLSLLFTPLALASASGIYVEVELPNGYIHRFGPVILENGDRIAFGFDKLVLNGSGYVEFDIGPSAGSIAALVMPYDSPDWNAIVSNDEARSWRLYISQISDKYEFMRRDSSGNGYVVSDGIANNYTLIWVRAYTFSDRLEIHATTSNSVNWSGTPASPASKLLIGSNIYNGVEQQAQRWIGEIHVVVITKDPGVDPRSYKLSGGTLELLFDPSWYDQDNSSFIALTSNGIIAGRLVGSAQLVGSTPRMWVLEDSYQDSYLHIALLPYGSLVRFYDSQGRLLGEYTVIGKTVGTLVVDYVIPWPPSGVVANGRSIVLDALSLVALLIAFLSPVLAYYYGLIGGLSSGFFALLGVILAWYQYRLASPGMERDLWRVFAWMSLFMFIFSITLGILRGFQDLKKRRTPRYPDLDF